MNSQQIIDYLKRLPGVTGSFVCSTTGGILATEMPEIYDQEMIAGIASDGISAFETICSEKSDLSDLRVDFDIMSILIRLLDNAFLFILVDKQEGMSSIRIAANVAAKRFSPNSPEDTALPSASTSPLSLQSTQEIQTKPVKAKKEKPKNNGSIWG